MQLSWGGACKLRRRFICTSLLHYRLLRLIIMFLALSASRTRRQQITIYYSVLEKSTKEEKEKFLHYDIKACSLYCRRLWGLFLFSLLFVHLVFLLIYVCRECEEHFNIRANGKSLRNRVRGVGGGSSFLSFGNERKIRGLR